MSSFDLSTITQAEGLGDDEAEMLIDLVDTWRDKKLRNELRGRYYHMKNRLKDLKISIPPALTNVETVVGWPAKAVDMLAARSQFDGYTWAGEGEPLKDVLFDNQFGLIYSQAVVSELIHSCSFLTLSKGRKGEPQVIISAYSALNAAALWDDRLKRIKCGMTIVEIERRPHREPVPRWVNLYTDDAIWEIHHDDEKWVATKHEHSMGRPMMEVLRYRPSLDRPFGKSRISRAVMSTTDSAVRCSLRTEVAAEFATSPQKFLLGADGTIFDDISRWEAYIGNILAISRDEDGEVPEFGQLSQGSMQQHLDYMRSLAAHFSGETGIPVSELGVIHDNPASAEAIYAAKESLVIEAESLNAINGHALKNIGRMAIAAAEDKELSELSEDEASIEPCFRNPAMPSIVTQADSMVKLISVFPWMANSDVALEEVGFADDKRQRLKKERERAQVQQNVQNAFALRLQNASSGQASVNKNE